MAPVSLSRWIGRRRLPMPDAEPLGNKLGAAWIPEMLEVHHQAVQQSKTARL
jgi:hypothetical protein